jgi:hypothetical protein
MKSMPCSPPGLEINDQTDLKWYSGLAMQAMIARDGVPHSPSEREEIALWAIRMAETMLAIGNRLHGCEAPVSKSR